MPPPIFNCDHMAGHYYNIDEDQQISDMIREQTRKWASDCSDEIQVNDQLSDYRKRLTKKIIFIVVCTLIMFVCIGVTITIGAYDIGFFETYEIIWNHITGQISDVTKDYVVVTLRMPSVLTALIAGAGLSICGVAMQSTLKNPLADPYTTGVSSGAGFGASLALALNYTIVQGEYNLVVNAFIFALIPTAAIIAVSKMKSASPTIMIMAGIAIMYLFNACTTMIKFWADDETLSSIYRWQVGTCSATNWDEIVVMAAVVFIGIVVIWGLSKKINLLATGDENARAMGVDAEQLRIICLIVVALVSASIVSFTGLIGFVGLVAPHIVRIFIGSDNRYLVPASAAFGAALLIFAYALSIWMIEPITLQVGVLTSFLGAPLFLWLIVRSKENVW